MPQGYAKQKSLSRRKLQFAGEQTIDIDHNLGSVLGNTTVSQKPIVEIAVTLQA